MSKVRRGFYLRAEKFAYFSDYLDELSQQDPSIFDGYGGKSFKHKSHGESFFSLFSAQFHKGIFLLDEPETALSPKRQIEFLALIRNLASSGKAQFIIATHSPIIMSIPEAQVLQMGEAGVKEMPYRDTEHFQAAKLFLDCPERFHAELI